MAATSFQSLFEGICALAGEPLPARSPAIDAQGLLAFHLHLGTTPVSVFQRPLDDAETLYVVVELGPMPADVELVAMRQLMEANHALLGRHAPCFSRQPGSGQVLLQWTLPLPAATPAGVHTAAVRAAAIASDWVALAREGVGSAGLLPAFV